MQVKTSTLQCKKHGCLCWINVSFIEKMRESEGKQAENNWMSIFSVAPEGYTRQPPLSPRPIRLNQCIVYTHIQLYDLKHLVTELTFIIGCARKQYISSSILYSVSSKMQKVPFYFYIFHCSSVCMLFYILLYFVNFP